jgi:deoxyribodipyrimidine photo-lyase
MSQYASSPRSEVPAIRIRLGNDRPINPGGQFVLYWMTACRRGTWNFALQRAVDWARHLGRPLAVAEPLPTGGRWDTGRHRAFVLQGMRDNAQHFAKRNVAYCPLIDRSPGKTLRMLAKSSCLVVSDDFPIPSPADLPSSLAAAWERVDGNGLLPLRAASQAFTTAHAFRRFLQKTLREHLLDVPQADPVGQRFSSLQSEPVGRVSNSSPLDSVHALLDELETRLTNKLEACSTIGGPRAAKAAMRRFLEKRLPLYPEQRNKPEAEVTSGLSPYLHFGHISVHEIFHALARQEGWSPDRLAERPNGRREGWWGMSEPAEAFLDELITWREVGFNMAALRPEDYDRYDSLPDWARKTLAKHARDRREHLYSLEEFEQARTHDPLWNAAQRQLVREGRIHNYLRMLWGKKILQWTASPQGAADVMIELNNRYALDGQDPNSYSGIFWVLGRYDRPWGPERPVFGTVRYMSSQNTARKVAVQSYLERYGE